MFPFIKFKTLNFLFIRNEMYYLKEKEKFITNWISYLNLKKVRKDFDFIKNCFIRALKLCQVS